VSRNLEPAISRLADHAPLPIDDTTDVAVGGRKGVRPSRGSSSGAGRRHVRPSSCIGPRL